MTDHELPEHGQLITIVTQGTRKTVRYWFSLPHGRIVVLHYDRDRDSWFSEVTTPDRISQLGKYQPFGKTYDHTLPPMPAWATK